ASAVTLGGAPASFTVVSATQIAAVVPDPGVTQARWRVTNSSGTGVYDPLFTIDPPSLPTITTLSSTHAPVGARLTLTGTNFNGTTAVSLGGLNTSYTVDSPTQISATVPNPGVSQARWRVSNISGTGVYDPLFTI